MNIVKANGIELAWNSYGHADAEPILLISGLGTQMMRWSEPFCKGLAARGYRVIRFDNRDAGCSTHFRTSPAPDFGALAAALMAGADPTCLIRFTTWRRMRSASLMRWGLPRLMSLDARWGA